MNASNEELDLNYVCKSMLDNADMRINLSQFPKVTLDVVVQGTVDDKFWKVIFECRQVVQMNLEADDDIVSDELFMVLETNVNQYLKKDAEPAIRDRLDSLSMNDSFWTIEIFGHLSLKLVTTKFDWSLVELTKNEYKSTYS